MTTVYDDAVCVDAEVARAARLLLDLDRYAARLRAREPDAPRLDALDARLDALQGLILRLALFTNQDETPG